ncbi:MAG: DUF6457 domain-containing protein [Actinomycetota bacterium]
MDTWIDELAVALALEPLSHEEADQLLRMARDVAHRVERKGAPLASFLLGMHVARRTADGSARASALDEAIASAEALLPSPSEEP